MGQVDYELPGLFHHKKVEHQNLLPVKLYYFIISVCSCLSNLLEELIWLFLDVYLCKTSERIANVLWFYNVLLFARFDK